MDGGSGDGRGVSISRTFLVSYWPVSTIATRLSLAKVPTVVWREWGASCAVLTPLAGKRFTCVAQTTFTLLAGASSLRREKAVIWGKNTLLVDSEVPVVNPLGSRRGRRGVHWREFLTTAMNIQVYSNSQQRTVRISRQPVIYNGHAKCYWQVETCF
jgi:hypothetical protein